MKGKSGKGKSAGRSKPGRTPGGKVPATGPTKDAPFDVDLNDDGDFATPKPCLDEDELKEQEDRRFSAAPPAQPTRMRHLTRTGTAPTHRGM